jgi:hypothetical protein
MFLPCKKFEPLTHPLHHGHHLSNITALGLYIIHELVRRMKDGRYIEAHMYRFVRNALGVLDVD